MSIFFFFFQAEDGIRDYKVTGVQTCALPISSPTTRATIAKSPSNLAQQIRGERAGARPGRRGATEGTLQREDEPARGHPASRPVPRLALPSLSILERSGFNLRHFAISRYT